MTVIVILTGFGRFLSVCFIWRRCPASAAREYGAYTFRRMARSPIRHSYDPYSPNYRGFGNGKA
jgi:hypothetical protein